MSQESFSGDEKTVDAVIRNFIIIGEAASQISKEIRDKYPDVPWSVMRDMRNVLTHVYFGVSLPIIWQTVSADLPPLVLLLQNLLEQERSADS
jgi:uncharacterized protein with HEPN domain